MKRTQVMAAMMAAAVLVGLAALPATAEAGFLRRRCDGEPRVWVKAAAVPLKVVTCPFASRVRRNQKGQLSGAF